MRCHAYNATLVLQSDVIIGFLIADLGGVGMLTFSL